MDGTFACPECGQEVETPSSGPGRQARCSFCDALVEIPYLPRVEGEWKRRRYGRPWWWAWAWWGVALSVMGLVAAGAAQALVRGERAARLGSIRRLVDSSRAHETAGRADLALRDLDAALRAATGDDDLPGDPAAIRELRGRLARLDANKALEALANDPRESGSLGQWLDLVARVGADRDLEGLRTEARARFAATLERWLGDRAARAGRESDPSAAFDACRDAADLAVHLPPAERDAADARFRAIAAGLVARAGAAIDARPGAYVRGSESDYDEALRPALVGALRAKGYLPPSSSRWAELWANAPYRLSREIRESYSGTYLETQNRLTRIDATFILSGPGGEMWRTSPNARTTVPIRGMTSYVASRLALSRGRSDEAERVLYADAFAQAIEKFRGALASLPPRPA